MPSPTSRTSAHVLAPLALVACAIAVFAVVTGSLGDGGDSSATTTTEAAGDAGTSSTTTAPDRPRRARYTVKSGDTLEAISDRTGVPVATIEQLNPELDPQALVVGQKIKLRE